MDLSENDIFSALGVEPRDAGTAGTSNTQGTGGTSNNEGSAGSGQVAVFSGQWPVVSGAGAGGVDPDDFDDYLAGGGEDGAAVNAGIAGKSNTRGTGVLSSTQGTGETSNKDGLSPELRQADAGKDGLSPEERQANAERRRAFEERQALKIKAAADSAVAAALAAERARYLAEQKEFFEGAKLTNPFTNTPIGSMEEFHAWRRQHEAAQLQQQLQAGQLTPEALERVIAESPAIKRAEELLQQSSAEQRQRQEAEFKARADAEIAEIGKLDPSVRSLEDILAMPTGLAFRVYVERGNSFFDAFRLANWEALTSAAAAAGRSAAVSNARSKDHLGPTQARGDGGRSISSEQRELYMFLNPGHSEADMQRNFARYGAALRVG